MWLALVLALGVQCTRAQTEAGDLTAYDPPLRKISPLRKEKLEGQKIPTAVQSPKAEKQDSSQEKKLEDMKHPQYKDVFNPIYKTRQ